MPLLQNHIAVVTGGPRVGDLEAGVVATATNAQLSVVSGGVACLVGVGLFAKLLPELAAWRASEDPTGTVDRLT